MVSKWQWATYLSVHSSSSTWSFTHPAKWWPQVQVPQLATFSGPTSPSLSPVSVLMSWPRAPVTSPSVMGWKYHFPSQSMRAPETFDKAKFKGFSVYKRIQVERSRMININSLHLKKNTIWSTPHADNTEHTNQRICKLNQVGLQREVKIIWNHHWNTNELMKLRYYKELVFGLKLIVISPVIFFSKYLNDYQLYIYIYSLFSLDFATISILKCNYNFPFLVQLKY